MHSCLELQPAANVTFRGCVSPQAAAGPAAAAALYGKQEQPCWRSKMAEHHHHHHARLALGSPPANVYPKAALVWPPSDGNGGVVGTGGGGGGGKGAPGSPSGLVHWMSAMAEHHDVHYMWNGIETKMNSSDHHGTPSLQKEPSLSNYHKGILGVKDKGSASPLPDSRHNFRWPPTSCHPNSLEEGRTPLESPSPQMHGGGNGGLYASSGGSGPPRPGSDGGASSGAHSPPQGSMLVVPQPLKGPPTSTTGNGAPPANGTPGRKYQCKMCPQVFVHKSAMQHHSREAHRGDLKPHQCQQCLKSFSSSHQLAQHVRIHTGEKPYKCSYCDRRFKQLSHVQQHTRLHTGERPYKCHLPECGRAFIQLSNLQQHLRDHDSQMERAKSRPYHCNICGKGFASDSSLRTHRSKQHAALIGGAASQSCPICHKICVNAEALMEHMRTSHRDPSATGTPSKRKQAKLSRKQQQLLQQHQQASSHQTQQLHHSLHSTSANASVAVPTSVAHLAPFPVRPLSSSLVMANVAAMGLTAPPLLGNGLG